MRPNSLHLAAAAALVCLPALAQTPPAAPPPAAAPAAPAANAAPAPDPVVARVGDQTIRLSDMAEAAQSLPEELRGVPQSMIFPMLLDQLIDRKVIAIAARKQGLDRDPKIRRQIELAEEQTLQTALLQRDILPTLTDAALRAKYDQDIAGKPGEEEINARHILVADEATAKKIIEQLRAGADFNDLAKKNSTDPSVAQNGGDLGFFKKGDMLPEFSTAAFALKPGEITQTPVHTRFGWHVIKLEARRTAPPPSFDESRDTLRQELIQDGVKKVLDQARNGIAVERFNPDGSPLRATDLAQPPPAAPR